MNYFLERSLYYYFLMCEIADENVSAWKFIAGLFGLSAAKIKKFGEILKNPVLGELASPEDIVMYNNYLAGFCRDTDDFGSSSDEQFVLEAKAQALKKTASIFGDMAMKSNRLRALSHNYPRDHVASVLYALQILRLNADDDRRQFALNVLSSELGSGDNSDAGLILLKLSRKDAQEIMSTLCGLPDMLLHPEVIKRLEKKYGEGKRGVPGIRSIGF
ncbi:MAG: hypothetical protein NC489_47380 [Ruminococcus flavefaciens]|nr:hypothetical protein [Ruminococcus flavefaciens]